MDFRHYNFIFHLYFWDFNPLIKTTSLVVHGLSIYLNLFALESESTKTIISLKGSSKKIQEIEFYNNSFQSLDVYAVDQLLAKH